MKFKRFVASAACSLLIVAMFLGVGFSTSQTTSETPPDVYVGVDMAYGNVNQTKAFIDKVCNYTNFIIFGCTAVSQNSLYLNMSCQYAYDRGMYFMAYDPQWRAQVLNLTYPNGTAITIPPSMNGTVFDNGNGTYTYYSGGYLSAKDAWGDHLLGVYSLDEPGGKQIDQDGGRYLYSSLGSQAEATSQFQQAISSRLTTRLPLNCTVLTSDYALYWFDYRGGYNGLLAEFAGNYSRQMNMALIRGAAQVQNKDWGVIITWKYDGYPYMENGTELYNDMVLAYDNGAKYIVVFDANEGWTSSILQPEHYQALQDFWNYVQQHPRQSHPVGQRTAFVLPAGYGCGFRGPNDEVWGIWPQDATGETLNAAMHNQLNIYGDKLDIIYDDGLEPGNNYGYTQLIYWNDPAAQPSPTPSPTPTESPTPEPTPSPTPSPTPTLTPTPSPTPSPTPTPTPTATTDPTPTPTATPSPTPEAKGFSFPIEYIYYVLAGLAIAALVAIGGIGISKLSKRPKRAKQEKSGLPDYPYEI
jgi:hypothetical protein